MNAVRDYTNIDFDWLNLKRRGSGYSGAETFDVDYEEQGPLYLADAVPIVVVKGVRSDSEGREFVVLCQKYMLPEAIDTLNNVISHMTQQCGMVTAFTPLFAGDAGAFGVAHDFKMFDRSGKPMRDYKNKSGHYRIMFVFDTVTIQEGVLTVVPKIQQLQFVEELKNVFDHCYWVPPVTIKVGKSTRAKKTKQKAKHPVKSVAEDRLRKPRVHGQVGLLAGLGLDESANLP